MSVRAAAARVLTRVLHGGASLSVALPAEQTGFANPADRALLAELAYGSLRLEPRLVWLLGRLMPRPLARREPLIHALLLTGLYQLSAMRLPAHAAVAESVNAARELGKDWAAGLVNAVLRRYQREQAALDSAAEAEPVARFAHPRWLLERLRADWPDDWEDICTANNARAPMTLRVNTRQASVADYRQRLEQAGLANTLNPHAPAALVLEQPAEIAALPGFADGAVSVQDAAAQLAAPLLEVQAGMRVLDACAAPGGKTAHLLESSQPGELLALDSDAARLDRVAETLARLNLVARLVHADAGQPDGWWDGTPFDRILLDAPCSATGVIRRHPDIKVLRRAGDLAALAAQQARLLDALWPCLAPGGKLLYATCSVIAAENSQPIKAFLSRTPDAAALPLAADWGRPAGHGRQILPGAAGMDGFFYALLVKAGG